MKDKILKLFVPGRICLFGEHSDWAAEYRNINKNIKKGYAIVSTLNLGIYATIKKDDKFKFSYSNKKIELNINSNKELNSDDEFFSYVLATANYMYRHFDVLGINIEIDKMTLPMKKGFASSACICILVTRAFNQLYDLKLNEKEEMEIAYQSERMTLSKCGRMDQVCAYSNKTFLIEFDCQQINLKPIKLRKNMYLSFAVFPYKKNTKYILECLNECYPYAQNKQDEKVQKTFGYYNMKTIKQVLTNLKKGNYLKIGKLMYKTQNRFDKYIVPMCYKELAALFFHKIYNDKNVKKYVLGMKNMGAGGDTGILLLLKNKKNQIKLNEYLKNKYKIKTYNFTIK